jgi:hypothetical protein
MGETEEVFLFSVPSHRFRQPVSRHPPARHARRAPPLRVKGAQQRSVPFADTQSSTSPRVQPEIHERRKHPPESPGPRLFVMTSVAAPRTPERIWFPSPTGVRAMAKQRAAIQAIGWSLGRSVHERTGEISPLWWRRRLGRALTAWGRRGRAGPSDRFRRSDEVSSAACTNAPERYRRWWRRRLGRALTAWGRRGRAGLSDRLTRSDGSLERCVHAP